MTQTIFNVGYADLSRAKQAAGKKSEKIQAEKEFLAILEKNLFLEQRHEEDWGTDFKPKTFTLDDLEVEFVDYTGFKEDNSQLSSLDPLSKVLSLHPATFKSNRLSAVNRQVCKLDKLPDKYRTTQVLLLSNNYIKDLAGLQQFKSLKTLSLSNNLITSFTSLAAASECCKSLEHANFEGNQICKYPFYRSHILSLFPSLNVLDNCPISDKERKVAKRDVLLTSERLGAIVHNYCLVCFLRHVVDLLGIHTGIRSSKSMTEAGSETVSNARDVPATVTRTSIRTLISSWQKENHFGEEVLEDIKLHYSLELSKVKHQLHYFCRKAEIKQDKATLWMTAFAKVLGHQDVTIKELGCRIEEFTPLDVFASPLDPRVLGGVKGAKEGALKTGKDNRSFVRHEKEEEEEREPVARAHGPRRPIGGSRNRNLVSSELKDEESEHQHRSRSRLRFRPIERRTQAQPRRREKPSLEFAEETEEVVGRETTVYDTEEVATASSASSSRTASPGEQGIPPRFAKGFTLAGDGDQGVADGAVDAGAAEQGKGLRPSQPRVCEQSPRGSSSFLEELAEKVGKERKKDTVESLLFQNIVLSDAMKVEEEVAQDLSIVEELRVTIESLDDEANGAVDAANKAIGDLNSDIDTMIAAQQNLERELIRNKLARNEAKNLLSLQKKQNAKLQESTKAIDSVLQENDDLKFQVASLRQENQEVLGELRREREKVKNLDRELQAKREAEEARRTGAEFARSCDALGARCLSRRVLLHYADRVVVLQKQRSSYLEFRKKVETKLRRDVLHWWRFIRARQTTIKDFLHSRSAKLAAGMVDHWRKWAATHRDKRLMMLDIHESLDQLCRRKVLREWRAISQAIVESQNEIAYTFQQFWTRKTAFSAFCGVLKEKRRRLHLAAVARAYVLRKWFYAWCKWCIEEISAQERVSEAESFNNFWVKKRYFNRFLFLVVLNERRHIAKLIATNHYVKTLQSRTLKLWLGQVCYEQKKQAALDHSLKRLASNAFYALRCHWDVQVSKKVRRKKMGVIGKIIANEKNAQLRATYFFKWYAHTKAAGVNLLQDQILEHSSYARRRSPSPKAHSSRRPSHHYRREPSPGHGRRPSSKYSYLHNEEEEYERERGLGENVQQQQQQQQEPVSGLGSTKRNSIVGRRESLAAARRESSTFTEISPNGFQGRSSGYEKFQNSTPKDQRAAFSNHLLYENARLPTRPPSGPNGNVRELIDLHTEISTLQNRILETLEN